MKVGILAVLCASLLCSCTKKPPSDATHIPITMRKFLIEPDLIRVRQGQKVSTAVRETEAQVVCVSAAEMAAYPA